MHLCGLQYAFRFKFCFSTDISQPLQWVYSYWVGRRFTFKAALKHGTDPTSCCKHFSQILVRVDMTASHSWRRFVACMSTMWLFGSTHTQRCWTEISEWIFELLLPYNQPSSPFWCSVAMHLHCVTFISCWTGVPNEVGGSVEVCLQIVSFWHSVYVEIHPGSCLSKWRSKELGNKATGLL